MKWSKARERKNKYTDCWSHSLGTTASPRMKESSPNLVSVVMSSLFVATVTRIASGSEKDRLEKSKRGRVELSEY